MTDLSKYTTKEELFNFLHSNKDMLMSEKKFDLKRSDAVNNDVLYYADNNNAYKEVSKPMDLLSKTTLKVQSVINTTNILDSHGDVHINGLWNKSLKEQKNLYLLREHKMSFDNIISDNVAASTKIIKWSDIGFDYKGDTEALIFISEIDRERNEFMFKQYAKGWVRNHSVGMRYVRLFLAINSEDQEYKEEKEVWDKYYHIIVNKETAMDQGYFWAVTEAKVVEGSAVPIGANQATPTQSVKFIEPSSDTQDIISEPDKPLVKSLFERIGSKI